MAIEHCFAAQHIATFLTFVGPPLQVHGIDVPRDIATSSKPLPAPSLRAYKSPFTEVNRSHVTDNS